MLGLPKGHLFLQQQSSLLKRTQVAQPREEGRQGQQQRGKPKQFFGGTVIFLTNLFGLWVLGA